MAKFPLSRFPLKNKLYYSQKMDDAKLLIAEVRKTGADCVIENGYVVIKPPQKIDVFIMAGLAKYGDYVKRALEEEFEK